MRIIQSATYKQSLRHSTPEEINEGNVVQTIKELPVPEEIRSALLTALSECQDPYCQSYIHALPRTIEYGKQINDLDHAIRVQINYIYTNLEEYTNEPVKNVLADWLEIPPEHRYGGEFE